MMEDGLTASSIRGADVVSVGASSAQTKIFTQPFRCTDGESGSEGKVVDSSSSVVCEWQQQQGDGLCRATWQSPDHPKTELRQKIFVRPLGHTQSMRGTLASTSATAVSQTVGTTSMFANMRPMVAAYRFHAGIAIDRAGSPPPHDNLGKVIPTRPLFPLQPRPSRMAVHRRRRAEARRREPSPQAKQPPAEWEVVRVDLWKVDGSPYRIRLLILASAGGGALFDQILLGAVRQIFKRSCV